MLSQMFAPCIMFHDKASSFPFSLQTSVFVLNIKLFFHTHFRSLHERFGFEGVHQVINFNSFIVKVFILMKKVLRDKKKSFSTSRLRENAVYIVPRKTFPHSIQFVTSLFIFSHVVCSSLIKTSAQSHQHRNPREDN